MRNQPNRKVRVASLTQAKLHFPLPTLGAYFAEFDFGRRSTHDRERFVPREEARRADICSGEYRSYRADSSFPFRSELLSSFGSHVLLAIRAAELARHAHRADSSFPCRSELLSSFGWHVLLAIRAAELARHAHKTDSSFPFRSEQLSSFGSHVLLAIRAAELARHAHRADSSFPCRSELLIEGSVEGVILVVRSCHMVSLRFVWVLLAVYAILIDLPRLQ